MKHQADCKLVGGPRDFCTCETSAEAAFAQIRAADAERPDDAKKPERRGGNKDDAGKARMDLIPPCVPRMIAEVLEFGARKYGPNNWAGAGPDGVPHHERGLAWSKIYAGLQRHLTAWWEGIETVDPESGKSHLANALCQLSFLAASEEYGIGKDDRFKWGPPRDAPVRVGPYDGREVAFRTNRFRCSAPACGDDHVTVYSDGFATCGAGHAVTPEDLKAKW